MSGLPVPTTTVGWADARAGAQRIAATAHARFMTFTIFPPSASPRGLGDGRECELVVGRDALRGEGVTGRARWRVDLERAVQRPGHRTAGSVRRHLSAKDEPLRRGHLLGDAVV